MHRKVLLVDDEASLRRSLSIGLSQYGYETESCENGINALKTLETLVSSSNIPAAVVIDIKLPDIDGIKLVKIIKFKYPGIPIVLITGHADRYNLDEIRNLRIGAFMEKPFSPEELSRQFARLMEEHTQVEPDPEPSVVQQLSRYHSRSVYALVTLDNRADFFEAYRTFYYMDNVLYCDAVKGEYDIVLLLQADSVETCNKTIREKVLAFEGVYGVEVLDVAPPAVDDSMASIIETVETALLNETPEHFKTRDMGHRVCSYVVMEVEKEKLDQIYPVLRLRDEVVYCDSTNGHFNLVLLVTGHHFPEIDRFISQYLVNTDGILKVKEYPIVNIFEM